MNRAITSVINRLLRSMDIRMELGRETDPFYVQKQIVTTTGPVVFDVGAYLGDVTAQYRKAYPKGTLHVFEPLPESFQALSRRFEGVPGITLNQVAISDEEGVVSLNANTFSPTNSILKTDPVSSKTWGEEGLFETRTIVKVPTTTIDAYCKTHQIIRIDILKLDVQGAELKVLHGARTMLEAKKIGMVYLEIILGPTYQNQPRLEDYLRFFEEAGYELLDTFSGQRKNFRLLQIDAIFVPAQ